MKIFAVDMNYAEYNKSQNETLSKKEGPVIFTKADSALLKDKKPFFIPDDLGTIEYETELVVRICRLGKTISERFAHRYYDAVTVGIDFTARELQQKLRAQGLPWDLCKGFDGSAALGEWIPKEKFLDTQRLRFHLEAVVGCEVDRCQRGCLEVVVACRTDNVQQGVALEAANPDDDEFLGQAPCLACVALCTNTVAGDAGEVLG